MDPILIHSYAEQNLGDDMFIKCLCNRYPSIKFYIFCNECYTKAFDTIPNLIVLENKSNYDNSIEFSAQVILGGSVFR